MVMTKVSQSLEFCPACGAVITDNDYFYRHKSPIMGYRCYNCGFVEYFSTDPKM